MNTNGAHRRHQNRVAAGVECMATLLDELGHCVEPTAWPASLAGMGDAFLLTWSQGAAGCCQSSNRIPVKGFLSAFVRSTIGSS